MSLRISSLGLGELDEETAELVAQLRVDPRFRPGKGDPFTYPGYPTSRPECGCMGACVCPGLPMQGLGDPIMIIE